MLQLKNTTPFVPALAVFPDEKGVDTLYVVLKATFRIGGKVALAERQRPVQASDVYWGDPGASSLKYPSDLHLCKPSTDVILVGSAWAPGGRPVEELAVGISVGATRKHLHVFGDRVWKNGIMGWRITKPEPFETLPLIYERAFGGLLVADGDGGAAQCEERNPVGVGYSHGKRTSRLEGTPLPNIEDLEHPIRQPGDRPAPAGFGAIPAAWLPRRSYAGTYDEKWQRERAPYLPLDFDPRFFNCAHPGLVCPGHLQGGEPVRIDNASQAGRLSFSLPTCEFRVTVRIAGRSEAPRLNLETLLIEPDAMEFTMLWRGAQPCDKQALRVEEVLLEAVAVRAGGTSL